jgi:hypothetical protein
MRIPIRKTSTSGNFHCSNGAYGKFAATHVYLDFDPETGHLIFEADLTTGSNTWNKDDLSDLETNMAFLEYLEFQDNYFFNKLSSWLIRLKNEIKVKEVLIKIYKKHSFTARISQNGSEVIRVYKC